MPEVGGPERKSGYPERRWMSKKGEEGKVSAQILKGGKRGKGGKKFICVSREEGR